MMKKIVAIVGRPNVGKSTLFNRLCRKRKAIVDPAEGVTRDRKYEDVDWNGYQFIIADTGGIVPSSINDMDKLIRIQAEVAIDEADQILFIVDARTGMIAIDKEVARLLYKVRDKVILVANKSDNEKIELDNYDFLQLGLGDAFPIAAVSGRNTGNLLDLMVNHLGIEPGEEIVVEENIKIAIIGKPNVGKSSIINRLCGEDTVIVNEIAGTTRDSTDTSINFKQQKVTFIDTAGLRKKKKIKYGIEYFSNIRTIESVNRADVVLLIIDSMDGLGNQDQKIASYAHRHFKNIIVVFNKWDLIKKDGKTAKEYEQKLRQEFPFLEFAPAMFVSALTNLRVHKLLDLILLVEEESRKRVPTSQMNKFLEKSIIKYPPAHASGKHTRIYYCTQQDIHPPVFIFVCNNAKLVTKNYRRYMHNQIRKEFKFTGATIKLVFRSRDKKDARITEI